VGSPHQVDSEDFPRTGLRRRDAGGMDDGRDRSPNSSLLGDLPRTVLYIIGVSYA
jgi:hypothetical protein